MANKIILIDKNYFAAGTGLLCYAFFIPLTNVSIQSKLGKAQNYFLTCQPGNE